MAKILVFAELHGTHIKAVSLEILGRLAGHTVDVAAIGTIPAEAVADLRVRRQGSHRSPKRRQTNVRSI